VEAVDPVDPVEPVEPAEEPVAELPSSAHPDTDRARTAPVARANSGLRMRNTSHS
jgi:hypothetical protein